MKKYLLIGLVLIFIYGCEEGIPKTGMASTPGPLNLYGDDDGDGWSNGEEEYYGTDPNDENSMPIDSDGDGWPDMDDPFPFDPGNQGIPIDAGPLKDPDRDGIPNKDDPDSDGDGTIDVNDGCPFFSSGTTCDFDGDGIGSDPTDIFDCCGDNLPFCVVDYSDGAGGCIENFYPGPVPHVCAVCDSDAVGEIIIDPRKPPPIGDIGCCRLPSGGTYYNNYPNDPNRLECVGNYPCMELVEPDCDPEVNCMGRECGDDGCYGDGKCGTCDYWGEGKECNEEFKCVPITVNAEVGSDVEGAILHDWIDEHIILDISNGVNSR